MAGLPLKPDVYEYLNDNIREKSRCQSESSGIVSSSSSRVKSPRGSFSKCDSLGILTDKPKYRRYGNLESRKSSFKNWPQNKTQDREELAKAGFAHTGVDDAVRCYFCGVGLRDWPHGACPWEQHVLASPNCGHVTQCKGRGFIRKVLADESHGSDVDDSDDVVDTVNIAIKRNEEAVSAARDFCSDENILRAAIKAVIKHDLQRKFSAVELVQCIDKIEERNEVLKDSEHNVVDELFDDTEADRDTSESDEDIEGDNEQLKENITCKICVDAFACIVALPCGHMVCCSQCISALTKCAICRMEIKGTVRAVMAV